MNKEQTLPLFFGSTETTGKYWSAGGTTYQNFMTDSEDDVIALHNGYRDKSDRIRAASSYDGWQKFSSTERRRPMFNDCRNEKYQTINVPYTLWNTTYNKWSPTNCRNWYNYPVGVKFYMREAVNTVTLPIPLINQDWGGASRRAWWSMQPRFQGEVSLQNFLFELKDFKDVLKWAGRINFSRGYNTYTNTIRRWKKSNQLDKMDDAGKIAATSYLSVTLAGQPFVRDMITIIAQLGTIARQEQLEFQREGDTLSTSHYSENRTVDDQLTRGTKYYWPFSSGRLVTSRFTASLQYKYMYDMRSKTDTFLKYWGLNPNFEAFWNAVPFSFIWDYFNSIAKAIHYMEIDPNVHTQPYQYCESVLDVSQSGKFLYGNKILCECRAVVDGVDHLNIMNPVFIAGDQRSLYQRRVTLPNKGTALPVFKVPTWGQASNLLALARCVLS